jgi:hypothetical protein
MLARLGIGRQEEAAQPCLVEVAECMRGARLAGEFVTVEVPPERMLSDLGAFRRCLALARRLTAA